MKIFKKATGGYLSDLEKSKPELFKTINEYRTRLAGLDNGADLQRTFDKRANIQYAATKNMPELERDAYIKSVEKEFATATDKQFEDLQKDLKSEKRFVPTYRYAADQTSFGPTSGYYRNLQDEIDQKRKSLEGLQITEKKTGTRTPYIREYSRGNVGLAGYQPPPPSKPVYELPKGYSKEFRTAGTGAFGQGAGRTAFGQQGQNTGPYGTYSPSDYYVKGSPEKYTYSVTRAQKAGDTDYDKVMSEIGRLEKRHKYRNLYNTSSPSVSSANIYSSMGMGAAQNPPPRRNKIEARGAFSRIQPRQMNKGGEIKGKGKAIRGFKFGGVK
tara:strand:- start:320 stop:1303 length:984 start_codon:yes stop_codon:yes gene_type:complete